ncbi:MAG: hypothetical protein WAO69_00020 [Aestuariivita sp.]|uniref:hypothetical protein n=1 Tax=Aestuariivita sp. TaxID=1872407 RepID=UPI003BAE6931
MTQTSTPGPLAACRIDPDAALIPLDLAPEDFQSALPRQHYHLIFEDAAIGLAVGIWDTTTMQEAFGPYPGDEYITVLDGTFAITDGQGGAVTGRAGQGATFRSGIPVSWRQEGYLRKVYLTLLAPESEPPALASAEGGVRVMDPGHQPEGREVIFFNDAGSMTVTACRHDAANLPPQPAGAHELYRVFSGRISLITDSGTAEDFGPDTHFFLPAGTVCERRIAPGTVAWHVHVVPHPAA